MVSVVLHVLAPSLASLLKSDVEEWSGPLEVSFAAWTGLDERLLFHYLLHRLVSATSVRAFFERKVLMSICFGTVATAAVCAFVDFLGAVGLASGLLIPCLRVGFCLFGEEVESSGVRVWRRLREEESLRKGDD